MSYMCGHRSEKQAQGIMSKILITSMVIRRIKDMCGQVISARYPNKTNHNHKKDETDSKGMMIFARPSGSGYPSQLKAIIPYGSTKAYSQRPTLFTRIFHIPLTRLTWLVWNIQVCSVRSKIPLQPQQFNLNGSAKTYHNVLPKMGIPTK